MQIVSKPKSLGGLILVAALTQGCATNTTSESAGDRELFSNSDYVSNSANAVVLASNSDCVRTISWTGENNVVECNSSFKAPAKAPTQTMVSYNGRALFEFDSATLTGAGEQELNQLTDKLNAQSAIKQIEIVGHADSIGSAGYNQRLSEQRAEAVKSYVQQSLLDVSVIAKGMGESSPIADNATDEGRRMNRRVDVNIAASVEQ